MRRDRHLEYDTFDALTCEVDVVERWTWSTEKEDSKCMETIGELQVFPEESPGVRSWLLPFVTRSKYNAMVQCLTRQALEAKEAKKEAARWREVADDGDDRICAMRAAQRERDRKHEAALVDIQAALHRAFDSINPGTIKDTV